MHNLHPNEKSFAPSERNGKKGKNKKMKSSSKYFIRRRRSREGRLIGKYWIRLFLSWLSGAGTSQEVFSLIWHYSTAPLTSPAYITLRWPLWRSPPPPLVKLFKWNSPDICDIVVVTRCCALHLCWWCITWPLGTMGAPTPLLWTIPRPWRPPNVILWSSREHFWEMF